MYEFIRGTLDSVQSNGIVIEAGGIGYFIHMANPYRFSSLMGQKVKVWLYHSVSENDMRLFGFKSEEEKSLFVSLIQVNGIGPKSALSILSLEDNVGFVQAVQSEDLTFLSKFPGVGKKTAQRIVLDLKDKLNDLASLDDAIKDDQEEKVSIDKAPYLVDLEEALSSLGYTTREINRVIKQADFTEVTDTAQAIRVALRYITKGK